MAAGAAIEGELALEGKKGLKHAASSTSSHDVESGQQVPPAEPEVDPTVVTWYGDDDPENPQVRYTALSCADGCRTGRLLRRCAMPC